ncbi:hypothetical protein LJR228_001045 [Mesorhizobium caraganae]
MNPSIRRTRRLIRRWLLLYPVALGERGLVSRLVVIGPADGSQHRKTRLLPDWLAAIDDNAVRSDKAYQSLAQEALRCRQITLSERVAEEVSFVRRSVVLFHGFGRSRAPVRRTRRRLVFFSSGCISVSASRQASSMATWMASQPVPQPLPRF